MQSERWGALVVGILLGCGGTKSPTQAPPPTAVSDAGASATPDAGLADAQVTKTPPSQPTPTYLADGAEKKINLRAALETCGPTSVLAADLEKPDSRCTQSSRSFERYPVAIVQRGNGHVQLVDTRYGVRYAIFAREADLERRVADRTPLLSSPRAKKPSGVVLLGGAKPTLGKKHGKLVFAKFVDEGISVQGWLPAAAMGRVFRRAKPLVVDALLKRAVNVRATPRGRIIARVANLKKHDFSVRFTKRKARGAVEVEIGTRNLRVVGYVPATAVEPANPPDSSFFQGLIGGGYWDSSHTRFIELPKGTPIAMSPGGAVFAVTLEKDATIVGTGGRKGNWYEVGFRSRWRITYGWVGCARVQANKCVRN